MNATKNNVFPLLKIGEIEELYQELQDRFDRVDARLTGIEITVKEILAMVRSSGDKTSTPKS